MDFTQVRSGGYRKKIQLHNPDVDESLAEKAGRLNEDGSAPRLNGSGKD